MLFKHMKQFVLEVGKMDDRHFRVESVVILRGSASTRTLKFLVSQQKSAPQQHCSVFSNFRIIIII